ncbi:MAG: hypothetical protein IJF07_04520, partial [Lachnospiraceae bacterium]|nr:hypothetical protein [Lachnospiraceae bacterium]
MKKMLIKTLVFVMTFIVSVIVIGRIMNKEHNNMTMEMAQATFPLITMERNGISYNQLHGYRNNMDTAFMRDTVTVLGDSREGSFTIDTYGREITKISMQVRSNDGSRLIEDTELSDYLKKGNQVQVNFALKDLIEKDTDYSLTVILELEESEKVYYYTRVIWSDKLYADEKLAFVQDFHERLYNRTAAKELAKYLETNSKLEDNSSFHKVNIHSSFKQITWGDLNVSQVGEAVMELKAIADQTASMLVNYMVSTDAGKNKEYYQVQEYYRVRYTAERM